mgnify:CR=1 FL=1
MTDKNFEDNYGDGDIPEVDLPQDSAKKPGKEDYENVEPLPESTRPRKDGPGRGIGVPPGPRLPFAYRNSRREDKHYMVYNCRRGTGFLFLVVNMHGMSR